MKSSANHLTHWQLQLRTEQSWVLNSSVEFLYGNKFFITAGNRGWHHHCDCWQPSAIFVLSQKVFCCETSAVLRQNCIRVGLKCVDAKLSTNIFTYVFCVYLWRVQCVMPFTDTEGEIILHSPQIREPLADFCTLLNPHFWLGCRKMWTTVHCDSTNSGLLGKEVLDSVESGSQ